MSNKLSAIQKLDFIDALRGVAILLVVMVHVSQKFLNLPTWFADLSGKGSFGVQLFFMVSSFTLFYSWQKRIVAENQPVRNFFIRRVFRIIPLYYLAIVFYSIVFVVYPFSTSPNSVSFIDIFFSATFLSGFIPSALSYVPLGGWSVVVEFMFYCLLPFFFIKISSLKKALYYFYVFFVLNLALDFFIGTLNLTAVDQIRYFNLWLPRQLPVFFSGIILYYIFNSIKSGIEIKKKTWFFVILPVPLALLFSQLYIQYDYLLYVYVLYAFFLLILLRPMRLFVNAKIGFIGKISFSIYLWHFIINDMFSILVLKRFLSSDPYSNAFNFAWFYSLVLSSSIIVSYLSYRFIEVRGIKYGSALIKKLELANSESESLILKSIS